MTETPNDAATDVQQIIAELQCTLAERSAECDELLLQQAASAEILGVINSSHGDLAPVFDAMLEKAMRLCEAAFGSLYAFDGEHFQTTAQRGLPADWADYRGKNPPSGRLEGPFIRLLETKRPVHIPDIKAEEVYRNGTAAAHALVDLGGGRTVLYVPLLKDHAVLGTIVTYRQEVRPFTDKQIALLENFAAQAVIAMENARLFNETKEALEQQAATSDILRVISQSPTDVQPVFEAIVLTAVRLTGCDLAFFLRCDGATYSPTARATPEGLQTDARPSQPLDPDANFPSRAIVEKKTLHLPDWSLVDPPAYERWVRETFGIVSSLYLPLLCGGDCIGLLVLAGKRTNIFGDREIALAESFRDQAVIAIQNARLFNETTEALERQTATADILKVIASSPSNVQPVFDAIAERSKRLVDALSTTVFRISDGMMYLTAFTSTNPEADAALTAMFPATLSSFSWSEAISNGDIYRVVDTEHEIETLRDLARLRGYRSMLFVPLLRGQKPIGVIAVTRVEPGPFVEHHVHLLQTFADQAVIAISNVQLFQQLQESTRELSASLDDLRTAQDRLVQTEKLASLGQLAAGIAHEIKNPLNFVNNFSALSAELVAEMSDLLAKTSLDMTTRKELDELAQMLRSNLEKVVQHGKRADSIVKNMLQHSREGSSEHRPVDINAIVDESLNLAYHGARAEKAGFSIALQRDLDPSVGMADVYPQEITRVLLNIISNGFYAATKRKAEAGEGFEPTLAAVTKNLGDKVEIRIRDNGTGIPDEVKEKIFNPFFTTKPSGEGTGLGLSISHDIIVKQHGGSIDVDTEPGLFTEFKIVLPRTGQR
jgi:signal transduction histidine kinase